MDTSNGIFHQKILSKRTLPVILPTMHPMIDNRIAPIVGASQTLSTPVTKEVVADAACGGAWINRAPRQVSRMGVGGSIPGANGHAIRYKPAPYPVLTRIPTIYPACGISGSLQVGMKRQSTSTDEVRNAQKLDTVVDGNFPNDRYYAPFSARLSVVNSPTVP